ncbi:MAG: hypothetical protein QM754_00935 [Tepidisphaeraceae bacterium]
MTLSLSPAVDSVAVERFARACAIVGIARPFPDIETATALDGSSSAKRAGVWLAGCSVPRRAAELMIRNESWSARSLCVISPTHGQQLRVILDRLGPTRALVAVVPSQETLGDMLASVDLLADLDAGRLHLAWDEASLKAIFDRQPGLAVPQQMVRLPDTDADAAKAVITWTQAVLAPITVDHARRLAAAAQVQPTAGMCVIAGRSFGLWDDAGEALARTLGDAADTDAPRLSSIAALAEHVAPFKTIIADRPRPSWLGGNRAWIHWLTTPAVPAYNAAFAGDGLLLADAGHRPAAEATGWPAGRIAVAGWPTYRLPFTPGALPALAFDVPSLEVPKDCEDVTSRHRSGRRSAAS